MLQVNGEVGFKRLIPHFAGKAEKRNDRALAGADAGNAVTHIPEADTHLPSDEGDAEGPGGREVRVFEGGGVLCEGVVMDDGRLLIMEGLTEEPLLTSQKHVTG